MDASFGARSAAQLRFATALLATNWKAALALRGAFWAQVAGMALNNLLFFTMWWIFFDRFEEIRGWRVGDMLALFGVVAAGFGSSVVVAGGVRDLARTIVEGELDALLTQPKNVLHHALGSRSLAHGWGDLTSGVLFVLVSGVLAPSSLPWLAVAVALSCAMFVASGVMLHSLAFWLGNVETLARTAWEFLVTFSLYPPVLFSGALRLVLFTLVPAGFIGYLPAGLLREFAWSDLALAVGGVGAYGALAAWVFRCGLARYESGSRFGVRG